MAIITTKLGGHGLPKAVAVKQLVENGALVYITGNGLKDDGTLTDSDATTEDDNFTPPAGTVINEAGDVHIFVSADGKKYTVVHGDNRREFSAVDSENPHP